jgi:catalase
MDTRPLPATELIDSLLELLPDDFPEWVPGTRPVHNVGIGAAGWFRPSDVASRYCRSPQFAGDWSPVVVRFSNANGQADPDGRLQVRGMAVRLHIGGNLRLLDADGHSNADERAHRFTEPMRFAVEGASAITDMVCMSVPLFMVRDAPSMVAFERAMKAVKVRRPGWWARVRSLLTMCPLPPQEVGVDRDGIPGALEFSRSHPEAQALLVANSMLRLPTSYARTVYHAVHAFVATGSDGVERHVRFSLEPSAGARSAGPLEPQHSPVSAALRQPKVNAYGATLPERYLQDELARRLTHVPCRFTLQMHLADPGDDPSDPTTVWKPNRQRIVMGTLELEGLVADQDESCERLGFNPGRLLDGLAPSDDPILALRTELYAESYRRRMSARDLPIDPVQCPFGFGSSPQESGPG